jgi:hypothetical protein
MVCSGTAMRMQWSVTTVTVALARTMRAPATAPSMQYSVVSGG